LALHCFWNRSRIYPAFGQSSFFVIRITALRRLSVSPFHPIGGMSSAEPRWRAG